MSIRRFPDHGSKGLEKQPENGLARAFGPAQTLGVRVVLCINTTFANSPLCSACPRIVITTGFPARSTENRRCEGEIPIVVLRGQFEVPFQTGGFDTGSRRRPHAESGADAETRTRTPGLAAGKNAGESTHLIRLQPIFLTKMFAKVIQVRKQ